MHRIRCECAKYLPHATAWLQSPLLGKGPSDRSFRPLALCHCCRLQHRMSWLVAVLAQPCAAHLRFPAGRSQPQRPRAWIARARPPPLPRRWLVRFRQPPRPLAEPQSVLRCTWRSPRQQRPAHQERLLLLVVFICSSKTINFSTLLDTSQHICLACILAALHPLPPCSGVCGEMQRFLQSAGNSHM